MWSCEGEKGRQKCLLSGVGVLLSHGTALRERSMVLGGPYWLLQQEESGQAGKTLLALLISSFPAIKCSIWAIGKQNYAQ